MANITDYITYLTYVVTAAAAAAAVLPQTGPSWWVALRKVVDFLAANFGHATNAAPKA
jgi:hypothetical protein